MPIAIPKRSKHGMSAGDPVVVAAFNRDATRHANGQPKRSKSRGAFVASDAKLKPHDPTRQSVEAQIAALRSAMLSNLRQIASLVHRGRMDKAAIVASMVATEKLRIEDLAIQWGRYFEATPEPEKPVERKPRITSKPKTKRYARWSEK